MLVDSHCHLDYPGLGEDVAAVLGRAEAAGVGRVVTISTLVSRVDVYRAIAEADARAFFTVGTHPHHAAEEPDVSVETLVALARHPRCVAIGEAGLDYFYDKSPRETQRRVFRTHIAAARESGLPLVVHARDADAEMIDILVEESRRGRFEAVLHCYSSGPELARVGVELGFVLSFSGIVTFKRSDELRAIARETPLDRILVETDAPYLAPQPVRGKPNEPAYVAMTAASLAQTLGLSPQELAERTTRTFYRVFRKAALCDGVGGEGGS